MEPRTLDYNGQQFVDGQDVEYRVKVGRNYLWRPGVLTWETRDTQTGYWRVKTHPPGDVGLLLKDLQIRTRQLSQGEAK